MHFPFLLTPPYALLLLSDSMTKLQIAVRLPPRQDCLLLVMLPIPYPSNVCPSPGRSQCSKHDETQASQSVLNSFTQASDSPSKLQAPNPTPMSQAPTPGPQTCPSYHPGPRFNFSVIRLGPSPPAPAPVTVPPRGGGPTDNSLLYASLSLSHSLSLSLSLSRSLPLSLSLWTCACLAFSTSRSRLRSSSRILSLSRSRAHI